MRNAELRLKTRSASEEREGFVVQFEHVSWARQVTTTTDGVPARRHCGTAALRHYGLCKNAARIAKNCDKNPTPPYQPDEPRSFFNMFVPFDPAS